MEFSKYHIRRQYPYHSQIINSALYLDLQRSIDDPIIIPFWIFSPTVERNFAPPNLLEFSKYHKCRQYSYLAQIINSEVDISTCRNRLRSILFSIFVLTVERIFALPDHQEFSKHHIRCQYPSLAQIINSELDILTCRNRWRSNNYYTLLDLCADCWEISDLRISWKFPNITPDIYPLSYSSSLLNLNLSIWTFRDQ